MVHMQKEECVRYPELVLLGPGWKMRPTGSADKSRSKVYVDPKGKEFDSLREALEAAGVVAGDEFLKDGHPWIGLRVTRIFNRKTSDGTIASWLPPNGDDKALWHVKHDDGDSEDLDESEAEEAIEEYFLRPSERVEASFQGEWYPGILRKIVRSKLEPYGVKCDSDKNNSMLLWVPRKSLKVLQTAQKTPLHQGMKLNKSLLEHKRDGTGRQGKTLSKSAKSRKKRQAGPKAESRPQGEPQQKAQEGRRKSRASRAQEQMPKLISWTAYQKMNQGRHVTTEEWRRYVRMKLELKNRPIQMKKSAGIPNDRGEAQGSRTATTQKEAEASSKPGDGKRVRKRKVNPDYLWGEDLRNPRRALVEKIEENAGTVGTASQDTNDDKCAVCTKMGDLLCCDGPCLRAFHLKCLDLNEKDLPEKEWFCSDCAVGRAPRALFRRFRTRPPPLDIPKAKSQQLKMRRSKQTPKKTTGSAPLPSKSKIKESRKGSRPTKKAKAFVSDLAHPAKEDTKQVSTPKSTTQKSSDSSRSARRNAGVPSRFKDSYLTLRTPQPAKTAKKRTSPTETIKQQKKQKVGQLKEQKNHLKRGQVLSLDTESALETKARLEQRLKMLENFLEKKAPSTPTTVPTPVTPGSQVLTPASARAKVLSSPSDLSTDGLEPWKRCSKCSVGRRSMTCAKQMCAVCCRESGACVTHCRFLPGDILRVFKGSLEGQKGLMVEKRGHLISIKPEAAGVIYAEETTVCLVAEGPKHSEDEMASANARKRGGRSTQCTKCLRRFRNRSALSNHQRNCRILASGVQVLTPFGKGTVQKVRDDTIAEVKLDFGIAFLWKGNCQLAPRSASKKKKKPTPIPIPTMNNAPNTSIETPRSKRQASKPLRFKRAQLSKPMAMCFDILMSLKRHKYGPIFSEPVTVPGYHEIIKNPMDLSTVERMMFGEKYDVDHFKRDVLLVWDNAMTFNPSWHQVHEMAVMLRAMFLQKYERVVKFLAEKSKPKPVPKSKTEKRPKAKTDQKLHRSKANKATNDNLDVEVKRLAQKMEMMRKRLQGLQNKAGGEISSPNPKTKKKKKKKQQKKATPKSSSNGSTTSGDKPVSWNEREILKQQIIQLKPEDLNGVAEIVRDAMPEDDDSTEVEVDLEVLESATIRKLQKYVGECMLQRGQEEDGSASDSSSSSSESD
mmetsp:Transcript_26891/g.65297  ORF Transcript_26891/g.65297 Transcript_26891/m.65297 type:complete len:1172 (+) Transcript_26891:268-3783(+)